MKNHLLSFGHGYSARALAALLNPNEWSITGTSRAGSNDTIAWPDCSISAEIETVSHILVSIAPTEDGDVVLNNLAPQLAELAPQLEWVGYLSTTGVYGDHGGDWVSEDTPLTPTTKRGELRVAAEAEWQFLAERNGLPLHIFRLAGIYGPGRGPFTKVRSGKARRILKDGQVFSRIHVEDIAQALYASIQSPNPGAIYNVCDNDPAPPEDVIAYAAELLNLPIPPAEDFATAEMTPMARSFYAESKRVRNDRLINELGISLKYPTYKSGLKALLEAE